MAAGFKLFGLFHREDRWVKERSLVCQALVTKLEKIRCTYFGPKTFRGCWTFITFIHCVDYFPCYLGCNKMRTWGVISLLLGVYSPIRTSTLPSRAKSNEEAVFSISRSTMLAEQSQIELGTIVNPATEVEEKLTPPPQQCIRHWKERVEATLSIVTFSLHRNVAICYLCWWV